VGIIGENLKNQRRNRQLTIGQVEEETKIRAKYLQALEEEEFGIIPGKVYVKGFLRTYATFLGLEASPLIEEYDKLTNDNVIKTEEPNKTKRTTHEKSNSGPNFSWNPKYNKYVAVIAAIIILAFVNKFYPWAAPDNTAKKDTGPLPQNIESREENKEENKEPITEQETPVKEEPQKIEGANLNLEVSEGESWMKIAVDGQTTFEGTLKSGETKSFQGEEKVSVRFGNAGVVQITFNGESIGTIGEKGKVVSKEFTRSN